MEEKLEAIARDVRTQLDARHRVECGVHPHAGPWMRVIRNYRRHRMSAVAVCNLTPVIVERDPRAAATLCVRSALTEFELLAKEAGRISTFPAHRSRRMAGK